MPNTTSSGSNPSLASGITTTTDGGDVILSNTITDDMLWDFTSTGTTNKYYIRPYGSTAIGIGCTTTNGANIRISGAYKDVQWTIAENASTNWQFKNNASTPMYLAVYADDYWRNYSSSTTNQNGKFYLYKQVTVSVKYYYNSHPTTSVTIGDSNYASFCSPAALDFTSTDVKAYKAKVDGGKVVLTQVNVVPANTGVILYCETADDYDIPLASSTPAAVDNNEMIGVNTRTLVEWTTGDDGKYNYILQGGVFKKAATGGHLKANRAYLHTSYVVPTTSARDYLEFAFEDDNETTAVNEITNTNLMNNTNEFFDLQGRKVAQPTKGLYIVNGKKVVIK
jgi:hypothetical protein